MRVEGQAEALFEELFPHGLVPQIMQLVVDTWGAIEKPKREEDEPKITNRFVNAMEKEGRRRRAPFRIMPHVKDVEKLDHSTGKGFVEIDIYVPHGYDSRCYFGMEAKKLNVHDSNGKWASQAGEYADRDGMGCFVSGRYSCHQCEGAMIGYVMDGDCDKAKASISEAIDKRAASLFVTTPCPLHPGQFSPGPPNGFETRHATGRGEFTIYHVLLAA